MTWIVELNGAEESLRELEEGCRGDGIIALVDAKYRLDPLLFAASDDYETVKTTAQREVDCLNGYARLFLSEHRKVAVGNISRQEPGKPKVHFVSITDSVGISARIVGFRLGDEEGVIQAPDRGPAFRAWRELVQKDQVVADVFGYLQGSLNDWTNLARIMEAIEHNLGSEDKLIATGWADRQSVKAFHASANNPLIAGATARHGARRFGIPKETMEIHQARQLVLDVARRWVDAKIGAANLSGTE